MNRDKVFFFIQAILKYKAFNFAIKLRYWFYKPFFKKLGKNVQIKDGTTFKYPSDIAIGDNSIIGEYCYFVGKGGLDIGRHVIIGAGSKVITSNHSYGNLSEVIASQGVSFEKVLIEDNIWFGFDVKVLAGSHIKEGSIVATNSVVSSQYSEKNIIIAGTPARKVRDR